MATNGKGGNGAHPPGGGKGHGRGGDDDGKVVVLRPKTIRPPQGPRPDPAQKIERAARWVGRAVAVLIVAALLAGLATPLLRGIKANYFSEPVTLSEPAGAGVWAGLEQLPWISTGNDGPALYVVGFRDCPACLAFERGAMRDLLDAGVDVRVFLFAREPDEQGRPRSRATERALLAEMYRTRDWSIYASWVEPGAYETEIAAIRDIPVNDAEAERRVAEARAGWFVIADVLRRSEARYVASPTLVWKSGDDVRTVMGAPAAAVRTLTAELVGEGARP